MTLTKMRFPQPRRATESIGKTIAVSQSLTALESAVAQALPGAGELLEVGRSEDCPRGRFRCIAHRNRLVASVDASDGTPACSLACLPPKKFLKSGARVPAWWFSAYEELGGGSPWHDGFDDNGSYYWTVDLLRTRGSAVKVIPMGFSKQSGKDFGEHPKRASFRTLLESSGLLDVDSLLLYWKLLPCETGRSPVVASLHSQVFPDAGKGSLDGIARALARAKRVFDDSRDFAAFWTFTSLDRVVLY